MVRRIISVMLAAALLSGSFGAVCAQDSGAVVLYPQAEIFVQSNNNRNFKDEPTVLAGRGRFPYIKFDLEPYMGKTVLSAVLKCYKTDVNKSVLGVFEVPDTSFTDDMVYQTRPDLPVVTPSANESAVPAIDNSLALIRATAPGKACAFEIDMTSMLRKCSGDKFAFMLYPVDIGVPGGSSIYANSIVKGRENPDYTADKRLRLEVTFTDDPDEITVINDMDKINLGDLSAVTEDIALPAVGESGETEITWESSLAYITADGKVTRPDYIEGDADVTLTATVIKNTVSMQKSFSATVLRKSLTDKERIALDSEGLRLYDGITTVRNLDFIKTGGYGTVFTYESSDPRFLDEDGVVTRPGSEETSAAVTVTVTAVCGDTTEVFTLNIYIPKQQLSNAETMYSSFNDVYGYVKNWTADKTEGTLPGQYPHGSFAKLSEDADYIFENCDKTSYTALSAGIKELSSVLKELIASAVTSDKVVDEENNGLEFSEYRISLMQDVAEGEIALLTEPDMYTKSAKIALKDYADYCKSVLDGTYKRPFTRNRDFLKPRPDEAIQFASKWITKTYPGIAENTEMGMAHMTRWYKSQYMLNNTTQLFTLSPSDDSFLNWARNSVNTSFGSDVLVLTGNSRLAFVRFDLGEIEGNINSAALKLTNGTTNNPNMMVRYIPDERDNWDENTLTYNSWCDANGGEMWLGDIFREFKPGGLNNTASIDVTELAKNEKAECDGILSIQIDRDTFPYPVGFYSKENTTPAAAGRQICLAVETDIQDKERFDEKYNDVKSKAEKMISEAKEGTDVGCYPKQYIDGLKTAFEELLSVYASGDSLLAGKSMVKVYDAMHDMRQNQVLRSDIDSLSTLFLTGSEMTGLAAKIQKSATLTNEYNIIKQMSDEDNMTAVDRLQWFVDDLPMDQICTYFKFYSSSGNLIFTPPSNTAYGTLEIYLPSTNYENSETGDIGHIWIDTVKIAVSGEDDIPIENSDFETGVGMPDYWETVSYSGNPVFKWETRPNYVDAGNASMYIENPTNQDCGGIRYTEKLPLYAGISHTLTFRTKIDKRFVDRGIVARITYYDKNDNVISVLEKEGNVKSGKGNVLQYAQADAIVYAVEGDPYYAEKCKKRLLFSLNDFCQGAEYWMVKGGRPDGIDAYGEVQGGRIMASACAAYTLIKDADVFSEDEMKRFADMIEYLAYFIMDIRDRTEDEFSRATQGSNWQTDMACGAGMYGMTFPEAPHSRQFLTNGALVIYGHMQNQLYDDGSWPESSRYLSSVINKFAPFAVAIGNARGDDWFAETKLPKVFEHLINIQTPPYIYFNGKIGTPPVGDDTLKEQGAFAALGIYSEKINSINPKLAAAMRKTWLKSGSPMNTYASEAISMQNFFTGTSGDTYKESVKAPGDYLSENIGQYIFRENSGTDREKFFDIISNKSALGHGHYDQGSFIFYANGLPLVMDPGIDGYFNSTKRWYTGSSSHACLLFAKNGDYLNTPTTSRADGVICSDELNAMRVTVDYGADGKHERSFALLEDGFGAVIIWDRVTGAGGETVFNMPVTAKKSEISGNTVYSTGYYGTDLKTTVLQPQKTDITTRWGPSTEFMPKISGGYKQNYVMSRAQKMKIIWLCSKR